MAEKEELEEAAPVDTQEAPPQPTIDLTDEDEDGPENEAEAKAETNSRRAWRRTMKANLKKAEERASEYERTVNELRAEMAGLRGAITARQEPPPQRQAPQDDVDPIDKELEQIQQQQQGLIAQLNAEGISPERAEKIQGQYWALQRKAIRVAAKAEMPKDTGRQSTGELSYEQQNAMMEADFPEAFKSGSRQQEARLELVKLMEGGQRLTYALARQAAKIVHERYSRKPPAPSEADRARHASTPGRAGASAGGSVPWPPPASQLNAARGYTQHLEGLTDEQRYKIWAKSGAGKRLGVGK